MADSTAAYDALRDTAGVLDDDGRALVRVWGDRAREMIGGLVTQHVAGLEPGRALYAFMLTPKGRPLAELRAIVLDPGELWLDLPAACERATLEHLKRYLPPLYARFEPLEDQRRVSVVGPRWAGVIAAALPDAPAAAELAPLELAELPEAGARIVRREPVEGPGADLYVPAERAARVRDALVGAAREAGGGLSHGGAYDVWRVERGVPAYGREIDLEVLPQETGQEERAIDYQKGCYTGQEVVARIHFRGHVNRRLVGVRRPGGPPLAADTELFGGERSRGRITSAVESPRLGPIGLAYVRREVEDGTSLRAQDPDGPPAEVVALPFEGSSPPG
jgi:folate-binding protein YgfZ